MRPPPTSTRRRGRETACREAATTACPTRRRARSRPTSYHRPGQSTAAVEVRSVGSICPWQRVAHPNISSSPAPKRSRRTSQHRDQLAARGHHPPGDAQRARGVLPSPVAAPLPLILMLGLGVRRRSSNWNSEFRAVGTLSDQRVAARPTSPPPTRQNAGSGSRRRRPYGPADQRAAAHRRLPRSASPKRPASRRPTLTRA